jgi:hypothetical protein
VNLNLKVRVPSQVMARQVGLETVILNLESGTYYGLDVVGARIWQLLVEGRTLSQVCESMHDEYEVEQVTLERDVQTLVNALLENRLVALESQ